MSIHFWKHPYFIAAEVHKYTKEIYNNSPFILHRLTFVNPSYLTKRNKRETLNNLLKIPLLNNTIPFLFFPFRQISSTDLVSFILIHAYDLVKVLNRRKKADVSLLDASCKMHPDPFTHPPPPPLSPNELRVVAPLNKTRANDISAVYNWTASGETGWSDRERILAWI